MNSWVVFDRAAKKIRFECDGLAGRILCSAWMNANCPDGNCVVMDFYRLSEEVRREWDQELTDDPRHEVDSVHGEAWHNLLGEHHDRIHAEWMTMLGLTEEIPA